MAGCAQLCATASRSAAVTVKAFGHAAIAVFAPDQRKRSSFVFSIVTLRHIRHLHTLWVRKCCMSRNVLFLVYIYSSVGNMLLCCKGMPWRQDGIGIHVEHVENLPFRASFERVFPRYSTRTFRMPCCCHGCLPQRKINSLTDGAKLQNKREIDSIYV